MGRPRTWTDEQLREAVATAKSFKAAVEKLGVKPHGTTYYDVKARVRILGLDTSHFIKRRYASYAWSEEQLRAALVGAKSRTDLLRRLGADDSGRNIVALQRQMAELAIPMSVLSGRNNAHRRWSDDELRAAVATSHGIAATIKALGLVPAGGNYQHVKRRIAELAIDTSHFTGRGWSRGRKFGPRPYVPLDQVLVANRWTTSHSLKQRLIREGLKKPECEICGWAQLSADGRLPLELDHINGDHDDNRRENLRILCPNCHSLQPTHRGSNQRRRRARVA